MSENGEALEEMKRASWYATLLLRALPHCDNLREAVEATEIALSMQPEPPPEEILLGMVGDEWHGPTPPGPGWVEVSKGARGGIKGYVYIRPEQLQKLREEESIQVPPLFPRSGLSLAIDIFNPKARAVLDKALAASEKISAAARKELDTILARETRQEIAQGIVEFIGRYRMKIASLLGLTQTAALLQGAQEVVADLPITPPGTKVPLPPDLFLEAAEGSDEEIHLPVIEEAVKILYSKNAIDRRSFDALDAASRQKAFTVSGVDARETLEKIRDALAENVKAGTDLKSFRKAIKESVGEGTFLSDAHLEMVYRGAVQSAFSDGQIKVLQSPFVRSGFPYAFYDANHDERVRENHLALEHYGIDGSNCYRIDDPVFQTFRPAWDWNCLLPGSVIQGNVLFVLKSWYSGDVFELVTQSGRRSTITSNHPVLTSEGFVAAKNLVEYETKLLCYHIPLGISPGPCNNVDYPPTAVDEIFDSFGRFPRPISVKASASDLHGDAKFGDGKIEIVAADRKLLDGFNSSFDQGFSQRTFPSTDPNKSLLSCNSTAMEFLSRYSLPPARSPGSGQAIRLSALPLYSNGCSFGLGSQLKSSRYEFGPDCINTQRVLFGELLKRHPGEVIQEYLVWIGVRHYEGPVYDVQTTTGYMVADSIIQSNCRCSWIPATVRQAAEAGIKEAQAWLETGVEPSPPAYVPMPPFEPPAAFKRELTAAPLSVQLALSIELAWVPTNTVNAQGLPGWKDTVTGEHRYQKNRPGAGRAASGAGEPPTKPPAPQPPPAQPRPPAQPEPQPRQPAVPDLPTKPPSAPPEPDKTKPPSVPPRSQQEPVPRQPVPSGPLTPEQSWAGAIPSDQELRGAKIEKMETGTLHSAHVAVVRQGGKQYFYKGGLSPKAAKSEQITSALAQMADVPAPRVRVTDLKAKRNTPAGVAAVINGWVEGEELSVWGEGRGNAESYLEYLEGTDELLAAGIEGAVRKGDVDRQIFFSYLADIGDRHTGNYMIANGRLLSVDHEYSMSSSTTYGPSTNHIKDNDLFQKKRAAMRVNLLDVQLDHKVAGEMVKSGDAMLRMLRSHGMENEADYLEMRLNALRIYYNSGGRTFSDFERAHNSAHQRQA
jgi:hypothetical protein